MSGTFVIEASPPALLAGDACADGAAAECECGTVGGEEKCSTVGSTCEDGGHP